MQASHEHSVPLGVVGSDPALILMSGRNVGESPKSWSCKNNATSKGVLHMFFTAFFRSKIAYFLSDRISQFFRENHRQINDF